MKVLITGGAGFIGSTVASALLDAGATPVILDNLSTGRAAFTHERIFYEGDICDSQMLDKIFADHPDISATLHCAGLIVVPDSVREPLRYYRENVAKSIDMIRHLVRNGCRRLLFSSTAALYRPGADYSVNEESPIEPVSPYGRSKAIVEAVLADCAHAGDLRAISLRYFNPIGADPSMRTGLQTRNPSHVLGKMIEASERGETFSITGTDWPTRDGTSIRDYIHVWDLAQAHVKALARFDDAVPADAGGYQVINIGTGRGTTVRELVAAYSAATGAPLACREVGPRPGDVVGSFSRSRRAADLLGWVPEHSIEAAIRHALQWRALDNVNHSGSN